MLMKLTDREQDAVQALSGVVKSVLSYVPALGQAIAGWDAYQGSRFERHVKSMLQLLTSNVEDIEGLFSSEWLKTDDGQEFAWKVFDAALDSQLADKQELFVNALVHGIEDQKTQRLEKLKLIDMLRQMSRASLMVLAEMDQMFSGQVRGPGRSPDPTTAFPQVDAGRIAESLGDRYDPYLVTAAVAELEAQGLFSRTGEWRKDASGRYKPGGGFATEMCYTDFAARFVEFIRTPRGNDT
jgi:hypothetical protein